jgi:hypothetical protein
LLDSFQINVTELMFILESHQIKKIFNFVLYEMIREKIDQWNFANVENVPDCLEEKLLRVFAGSL